MLTSPPRESRGTHRVVGRPLEGNCMHRRQVRGLQLRAACSKTSIPISQCM